MKLYKLHEVSIGRKRQRNKKTSADHLMTLNIIILHAYVVYRSQPDLSRLARDSDQYDQEEQGEGEEGVSVEEGVQENDEDFQVK
jgi:hypothetical protein